MEGTLAQERRGCFSLRSKELAEFGMHPVSLKFVDAPKEKGFAAVLTGRLARIVRNYTAIWSIFLVFKIVFDVTLSYDVGTQDPQVYVEAKVASAAVDVFILVVGTSLFLAAHLTLRCLVLSLRQLEGLLVVALMTVLLVGPLVPLRHSRRVLLRKEDVAFAEDFDAEVVVTLMFDVTTTIVSLTPARFSSIWMIYLFAIVWYPVSRLLLVGSALQPKAFFLQTTIVTTLTCMAMAGKVLMEVQERRLFHTVASERTMRAESEFRLSQQDHHRSKGKSAGSDASAAIVSCDTADLFASPAGSDAADVHARLKRIETLARHEHWLIEAQDVELAVSNLLGRGGFGAVVGGCMRGLPVAVKISLEKMGSEGVQRISSLIGELRVLRQLRHPSIVTFYGAIVDPESSNVAAVLEFASGPCLTRFIQTTKTPLADEQSYRICCSTASALQYLHGHCPAIVHGDLKPGNIMVELSGLAAFRVKLVDFGLSRILKGQVSRLGGTLTWTAPELLASRPITPTASVDMYGLGRIMLFVLAGEYPFLGWSRTNIREALLAGKVPGMEMPAQASDVHLDLWKLSMFCASTRPSSRPPTDQACWQLRGLAVLPSMQNDLGTASKEIWGWHDFGTTSLEPWDEAMPQLRQILRRQTQESVEGRVDALVAPASPAHQATSSPSMPVTSVIGMSTVADVTDSSRAAAKLSPIIEGAEDGRSKQESRTSQSSSSNIGEAAKLGPNTEAAFAQVFADRLAL